MFGLKGVAELTGWASLRTREPRTDVTFLAYTHIRTLPFLIFFAFFSYFSLLRRFSFCAIGLRQSSSILKGPGFTRNPGHGLDWHDHLLSVNRQEGPYHPHQYFIFLVSKQVHVRPGQPAYGTGSKALISARSTLGHFFNFPATCCV